MLPACRRGLFRLSNISLGPKKAKAKGKTDPAAAAAAAAGPPGSEQLFNIYADRPDHQLRPDEWYPKWLWELEKPPKLYGELALTFIHGVNIEQAELRDYQRFLRLHRRLVIKLNNLRLKKNKRSPELKIP
mmetsp:Transcript_44092/g.104331  ORF Transcript_44092/g.104331 Transcript_44092/m.104331 type:complete len:131 (-) Transcript_44092:39-431(-)